MTVKRNGKDKFYTVVPIQSQNLQGPACHLLNRNLLNWNIPQGKVPVKTAKELTASAAKTVLVVTVIACVRYCLT